MKAVAVLLAIVAAANAGLVAGPAVLSAPTIISRAPAFDSAVIKSDRLGGNFAYSVAESHAYAAHTPVVQQIASPVAVSYSAGPVAYSAGPVAYSAGLPLAYSAGHLGYSAGLPLGLGYGLGHSVVKVA
ncbi:unnamed protein product [Allacma fusca]|uniref:Uncharacterized protein n=1 Tax=Allacma fusca TaxID=39272 RepID=A0A8J2LLC8_9HEXA|nr:unnamed protein product [Allacma fusca]